MLRAPALGKLLLDTGVITQQALDQVLAVQKTDKRRLGELLVEKKLVRPDQLAQLLSRQLSCPWVSLSRIEISPNVVSLIPRRIAEEFRVVPVHLRIANGTNTLYVATDDPTDDEAFSECEFVSKMKVRPMVAITSDVTAALVRFYGVSDPTPPGPRKPAPPVGRASLHDIAPETPAEIPRPAESAEDIEDVELVPVSSDMPPMPRVPKVITLNAPAGFLARCKEAAGSLGAEVVDAQMVDVAGAVERDRPCAIVVTEDVYAFDRAMLSRLALESDAVLVVWSDDVEGKQLTPLLEGAVRRWRRSSYEKGALVGGRYELLRDLGGNIGGSRWEVKHARTRRRAVLKVGVRSTDDHSDVESVRRELAALARVHHPTAIDLRDAGETELGDPYVVVELVEGRTIEGLVTARGRLPVSDACSIFHQIADCLAAAHAAGVTHGAVRPENIVLVRDGYGVERAKLIDWESATCSPSVNAVTAGVGADITAFGRCLFHSLVGQKPTTDVDVEAAFATTAGSRELLEVVRRAMTPGGFSTMAEAASALEGAHVRAREASRVMDASRRVRSVAPSAPESPDADLAETQKLLKPELRKFVRAPYRTPVRIEVPGVGAVDGRSEDISEGGLFLVTRAPIAVGTAVTIRFALPIDGRVTSEGAVVKWSRAARGDAGPEGALPIAIGVALDEPAADAKRQIERYVSLMGDESL